MDIESLKYPVGKFARQTIYSPGYVTDCIDRIKTLPQRLEALISDWPSEKFEHAYRVDGWNGRQVVHHLLDSHINALIRLKLALTEDSPTIKPYEQDEWIKLADYQLDPMMVIPNLKGIHQKLVAIFESMDESDYARQLVHPEHPGRHLDLLWLIGLYSWHSDHHLGHLLIIDNLD